MIKNQRRSSNDHSFFSLSLPSLKHIIPDHHTVNMLKKFFSLIAIILILKMSCLFLNLKGRKVDINDGAKIVENCTKMNEE